MYNSIDTIELGLASIVCIGYIVGKWWIYHNHTERSSEETTRSSLRTKESNSIEDRNKRIHNGVIKRGKAWDVD